MTISDTTPPTQALHEIGGKYENCKSRLKKAVTERNAIKCANPGY
jgi:hypothetical protein